ncbi:hypothetical protein BCV72DRAFT_249946 [Rhizopus microsporus var. microsporus]|uniref:Uncharacterized protein n=2 Tax=Rhizopus microsporus TaxID=58291 RepID=A0A2G4SXR9_RHIZD|nr:uncharacterized protein RHIMIDRAFT_236598 [Rhizopus microsporus ATCC 52813]ORE06602.1 hypothetical protein BCV72DRAFT_249946 [Rhizopus microsporus var. microsporus]PHZ13544.1 hypothetical protein RHIMIDRAFT_236598 [Rhizopus microsporus ATCC 52813]
MAAACTFSVRSANHGYKFLYLPLRRRLTIGKLRPRMRQLNINTHRVLNIYYPGRHLVALLVHNDYGVELYSQLKKFKISVQDDYDPLDSSNLRDPDYDYWDEANMTCTVRGLFTYHILHAFSYLKGPVKQTIADFFASKGYIDRNEFSELFSAKQT